MASLSTVNTTAQELAANGLVAFATNRVQCCIRHAAGSTDISLVVPGHYLVSFDADILPDAAGVNTVQLLDNNTVVGGAQATITGVANETEHISFTTLIIVKPSCNCVNNAATLQVQVQQALTVTNANLTIVKFA